MSKANSKELFYFLTLFKIKGHSTWRTDLSQTKDSFEVRVAKMTTVTEKKVYRIDRITGVMNEEK